MSFYKKEFTDKAMGKRIFIFFSMHLILTFFVQITYARYLALSRSAEVYLITCTPGDAIYEAFGHSALRIKDDSLNIDVVFNYGIFDFEQPNFFVNYVKGYLNYMLGVQDTERFLHMYKYYGRGVRALTLNLSAEQKQKLWHYLLQNAEDENKYYLYDYFFNNCSTKLWDVLKEVCGNELTFIPMTLNGNESFRTLIARYAVNNPWGRFGIDLGLGSTIDTVLSPYHYMFLPDYLEAGMQAAMINLGDTTLPLGRDVQILAQPTADLTYHSAFTPNNFFWALFILTAIATVLYGRSRLLFNLLYYLLFIIGGTVGCVLFFLFFTDHEAAYYNYNLIWANPILLICVMSFFHAKWHSYLNGAYFIIGFLFLGVGFWVLPQGFNSAFFPACLSLWLMAGVKAKLVPFNKSFTINAA
jgi:hypothetical protein